MSADRSEQMILLERASQTVDEAELLFDNEYYNAAVNRIYYACFYEVKALIISKDIDAKKHSGVKQTFGLHFVNPGIISQDAAKFYTQVFEMRQESDYEFLIHFEKEEVTELFPQAKQLIAQITQYLTK